MKRTGDKWLNENTDALVQAIIHLDTTEQARDFLRDLLTENELVDFGHRWKVARMLHNGVSYIKIEQETGMSSTTIARIQKWLKVGTGGYRKMIERIGDNNED